MLHVKLGRQQSVIGISVYTLFLDMVYICNASS